MPVTVLLSLTVMSFAFGAPVAPAARVRVITIGAPVGAAATGVTALESAENEPTRENAGAGSPVSTGSGTGTIGLGGATTPARHRL